MFKCTATTQRYAISHTLSLHDALPIYRACRRAASDQTTYAQRRVNLVTRACRLIEASDRPPTRARLGAWAGMSPFYFQRIFKAETGVSPKAYSLASRDRKSVV